MLPFANSLLKYDNPVLISKTSEATSKVSSRVSQGYTLTVSPNQSPETIPVPPPPKQKAGIEQGTEDILDCILPPRQWKDGNQLWVQHVSSAPCTRTGVLQLCQQLDEKLQEKQAKVTGICPIRREIYSQCFDELIRQVTINCAERGMLLLNVRDEINETIAAFRTLYESSVAFGMRKALLSEERMENMEKRVAEVEKEKQDLVRQISEQKAKCDDIERREAERRQEEERKFSEEINFLKRTNQQLKNQLESITTLKN